VTIFAQNFASVKLLLLAGINLAAKNLAAKNLAGNNLAGKNWRETPTFQSG
jgi:hypothetical protein